MQSTSGAKSKMRPRVLSAPPLLYSSSSVSLSHSETPFHLSRWADLQTATSCQPDVTLFTKLSLTIGWWGWLVTAFNPGLTMGLDPWLYGPARSPCGKWPLSPNPPWLLSMPRPPSRATKGGAPFLQDFATVEREAELSSRRGRD